MLRTYVSPRCAYLALLGLSLLGKNVSPYGLNEETQAIETKYRFFLFFPFFLPTQLKMLEPNKLFHNSGS
jgi:hypothetical protein